MEFISVLPRYGEAFLRLFFPSVCALCNKLLELDEQNLCAPCRLQVTRLKFRPSQEKIRISLCHGDEGWALFPYQDLVKEILHKIKFGRERALLEIFADEISSFMERRSHLAGYDLIIPIPIDLKRRLDRQFNQSGLLAKKIHQISGLLLESNVLLKRGGASPQSLLGREGRLINISQAFRLRHANRMKGKSILLVDDIFTTGATMEEAARTLKEHGANRVGYLALARTLSD
ncbi:MAG: ComF family protein [Candidatus Omnitrophica bacterium]|nr:ComF family protein [Candidatus Omnitrophota bacterium]